jgi:putative redox protein
MEVTAQYRGGVAFEVAARDHRIVCDQPKENSGADAGMTPPELLLASLATCAGYYANEYLRTRGLPGDGLGVRVVASKALKPARLADLKIELTLPELEERHVAGISRAVKACLIHNTLLSAPNIETVVLTASSALV